MPNNRCGNRTGSTTTSGITHGIAAQRDTLVAVVAAVAARHRGELERRKSKRTEVNRPDFLWHYLLQSFATMGNSRGSQGLIDNPENYDRLRFATVKRIAAGKRPRYIEKILRAAQVRYPEKKSKWIAGALEQIVAGGGVERMRQRLLEAPGRDAKIDFLTEFKGIGPKYARNLMMDVFHPDFHDSIAIDSRIDKVLRVAGVSLSAYPEKEDFLRDVARRASLSGWELDRCLYNYLDEVIAGLNGKTIQSVSVSALANEIADALTEHGQLSAANRGALCSVVATAIVRHRDAIIVTVDDHAS